MWIYAAIVLASLVWGVWEVGLDWWQLAPRGGVMVMIGIILALPPVVRVFYLRNSRNGAWTALGVTLLASGGIAAVAATVPTHDMEGTLPGPTIAAETIATAGVPPGEWQLLGRTQYGQRYSPLDQITPENVAKPGAGLDLSDRRRAQAGGRAGDDLSGDAAQGRRHALYLHAA